MKKLNNFIHFDTKEFLKDKRLIALGQQEWKDFSTKSLLGTRIEVVIAQDKTDYGEEGVSNLYEKFVVKIPKVITVPVNTEIRLKNPEAKVYGEFHNQLSVVAEDIEVISK